MKPDDLERRLRDRMDAHGLRHSFATLGLDAGADVLDVAALLGHSSPAITQAIYQHTRPERLRKAAASIAESIFG
jgi:integrase